jgi:hypothetical protein
VRRRLLLVSLVAAALSFSARAADVLFPAPIHLTRQLQESIGGAVVTLDQYCYGNRVVTVNGPVTSIADYGKGELTEINREDGTYSITRFDDVAKAMLVSAPASETKGKGEWKIKGSGLNQLRTTRASDAIEAELDEGNVKRETRVAVDRTVSLSKDALDVLIGAAYPNSRKAEDTVVIEAAKSKGTVTANAPPASANANAYALPVEQQTTFTIDGMRAETRDVVTRVGQEQAPTDLLAVPPDARLVESRLLQRMHALELIESAGRTPLPQKKQ